MNDLEKNEAIAKAKKLDRRLRAFSFTCLALSQSAAIVAVVIRRRNREK